AVGLGLRLALRDDAPQQAQAVARARRQQELEAVVAEPGEHGEQRVDGEREPALDREEVRRARGEAAEDRVARHGLVEVEGLRVPTARELDDLVALELEGLRAPRLVADREVLEVRHRHGGHDGTGLASHPGAAYTARHLAATEPPP